MIVVILLAGVVFYEAFFALRTLADVDTMQTTMLDSLGVVRSTTMSDEEKAAAMQRSSLAMAGAVGAVTGKILAAVAASALFLFAVSLFAWSFRSLVEYSIKPLPLIAVISTILIYGMIRHGRRN